MPNVKTESRFARSNNVRVCYRCSYGAFTKRAAGKVSSKWCTRMERQCLGDKRHHGKLCTDARVVFNIVTLRAQCLPRITTEHSTLLKTLQLVFEFVLLCFIFIVSLFEWLNDLSHTSWMRKQCSVVQNLQFLVLSFDIKYYSWILRILIPNECF